MRAASSASPAVLLQVLPIELLQQVELAALLVVAHVGRAGQVVDRRALGLRAVPW